VAFFFATSSIIERDFNFGIGLIIFDSKVESRTHIKPGVTEKPYE